MAAPRALPSRRGLLAIWAVAAVVGASAWLSASRAEGEIDSQSHARAGIFDYLPYESTARAIDGRIDRYWSGDFVRFTGAGSEVEPYSFVLSDDGRDTEVLVATRRKRGTLRFQVTSEAEDFQVELRDWMRQRADGIETLAAGTAGLIDLRPAPAWRHHPYWWAPSENYRVWVFRLRVASGASPVRLRYLGDGSGLDRGFEYELLGTSLEAEPVAGGLSAASIEVTNRSDETWTRDAVLPVVVGWRIFSADGVIVESQQAPLVGPIGPGEKLSQTLQVRWPEEPGRYELEVDLVKDQVARFGDRKGRPVATWSVDIDARPLAPAVGF